MATFPNMLVLLLMLVIISLIQCLHGKSKSIMGDQKNKKTKLVTVLDDLLDPEAGVQETELSKIKPLNYILLDNHCYL